MRSAGEWGKKAPALSPACQRQRGGCPREAVRPPGSGARAVWALAFRAEPSGSPTTQAPRPSSAQRWEARAGTGRLVNLQDRQEGFLGDLERAHLLHPTLSFFLFLEQLALAGDVAAVALGRDVLAQGADRFPGDHLGADRRLDHHLEQLPRDQLAQLLGDLLAPLVRLVAMDDDAEGVHRLPVEQHVELHEVGTAVAEEVVIERSIAARDRLELVVEVEDDP